jgi:hypothetical protein
MSLAPTDVVALHWHARLTHHGVAVGRRRHRPSCELIHTEEDSGVQSRLPVMHKICDALTVLHGS